MWLRARAPAYKARRNLVLLQSLLTDIGALPCHSLPSQRWVRGHGGHVFGIRPAEVQRAAAVPALWKMGDTDT